MKYARHIGSNSAPAIDLLIFVTSFLITLVATASSELPPDISVIPLSTQQSSTPMTMLVVGRDHTLFFDAYNDASDIDGDGTLDVGFKPSITYYGLFDSTLCYSHSGGSTNSDKFSPSGTAGELGTCSGAWSGNWLNYATTSRIDALRKVFYGGYRDVDTDSETILRRAYIPQDGHSWAKEYTSTTEDGYSISDYTPFSVPSSGKRHFFGNLTAVAGVNCSTLSNCSDKPPLLRVVKNSSKRVWDWASSERPVLKISSSDHGGDSLKDYTVRVKVCTDAYPGGCKRYPHGNLKPIGLLQEYGENESMFFGILTGSYNKNMSGGVLRKVASTFADEVKQDSGVFTAEAKIVHTLDNLRIRDFNNGRDDDHYRKGSFRTGVMLQGDYVDWGNPIGEMMYETLRYYAGKGSATSTFQTSGSFDAEVGLSPATWDNPYATGSAAEAAWCAKPNILVMSSVNISYDSDQLPGSAFAGAISGDLSGLNVSSIGETITDGEPDIPGPRFIGAVGSDEDYAPTVKDVTTLGDLRGLAPEEPTKQGSYYSASVAYYGKTTDLNPIEGNQLTDTYVVALASPLPKFEFNVNGNVLSLVPFSKTINNLGADRTQGKYQPANTIVDLYMEEYSPNKAIFRINYEADEQGNDFDQDFTVKYEIEVVGNTLVVTLTPIWQSTGSNQNAGYVISGTDRDGPYLVVQDKYQSLDYFLNVPPGRSANFCNPITPSNKSECSQMPCISNKYPDGTSNSSGYENCRLWEYRSVQTFSPGTGAAAGVLKNPLWYAAKWGGFVECNPELISGCVANKKPDLNDEWDADHNGVPDTYFLVQNPLKLRESLKRSFDTIIERSASAGNITSNGQQIEAGTRIFQSLFNSANWDGELLAYPLTASGVGSVPTWKASDHLPSATSRNIVTWNDTTLTGVDFTWGSISSDQQALLENADVLNYLRGSQSQEIQNGGVYRNRSKLLGDFINSSPYYVKDTDTGYIGGNDGMLHAFDASTGIEEFAYIPNLIFDKLVSLSSPSYIHKYYVDGDIAVSTLGQTPGQNILVASTGRGTKGLFALDVTSPGSFSGSDVLWEYDGELDSDLGFVLGRPQIGTLENGETVAIVGNGHDSVNGKAVLYVFNLETGVPIKTISVTAGGDRNGLSTPTLYDSDNNGYIDTVYAGDLKGNVWRFDVAGSSSAWESHFNSSGTSVPLFVAMDALGNRQPITAQVTVAIDTNKSDPNYGKVFVFFGTGSYVYQSDPADTSVQSWYGLIDRDTQISARTNLTERTIDTLGTVAGYDVRVFSEATTGDMVGKDGWFVDLKSPVAPTERGERIVTRSNLYQFLDPVLLASSIVPDDDPCEAGGSGYVSAISPFTGARLTYAAFDLSDDAKFDESDKLDGIVITSVDPNIGMPGEPNITGTVLTVGGSTGEMISFRIPGGIKITGRRSWREIQGY